MLNVDRLVARVRRETRNEDNSNTVASDSISDNEFIDALNDAQERLQSIISSVYSTLFEREVSFDVGVGDTEFEIDDNVYLGNRIVSVEYTPTGNIRDYRPLEARDISERERQNGIPSFYFITAKKIILCPTPITANGILKVTYEKTLSRLDKKRATITTVGTPYTASGVDLINLTLSNIDDEVSNLIKGDYITSLTTSSTVGINKVMVWAALSGSTLTVKEGDIVEGTNMSDGDTFLIGKDAVFTPDLPDCCERYLIAYAVWQIFSRDDLKRAEGAKARLAIIEEDLLRSFSEQSKDAKYIPMINKFYQ